jgi:mRNA interferase RelE/StbE
MASVILTQEAKKQVDALPLPIRRRLLDVYARLALWPAVSGAKPLRHGLSGSYRIRTGDYRIIFRIDKDRVIIWRIGYRGGIYD